MLRKDLWVPRELDVGRFDPAGFFQYLPAPEVGFGIGTGVRADDRRDPLDQVGDERLLIVAGVAAPQEVKKLLELFGCQPIYPPTPGAQREALYAKMRIDAMRLVDLTSNNT